MATFRPFGLDDPDEYIRGGRALNALLLTSESIPIDDVFVVPGHIAVTFSNQKRLCVFDTTPKTHRFAEHEYQRVLRVLKSEDFESLDKLGMLYIEFVVSIVSVVFSRDRADSMRVLVHLSDGNCHVWKWSETSTWQSQGHVLVSPITEGWSVYNTIYSAEHETYVWWQRFIDEKSDVTFHHIFARRMRFLDPREAVPFHMSDPFSVLSFWNKTDETCVDFGLLKAGKRGVWIRGINKIIFFELPTCILHSIDDQDISQSEIMSVSVHTIGSEVVVLTKDSDVHVYGVTQDGPKTKFLCHLGMEINQNFVFFAHRHWIGLLHGRTCGLYHATSGSLVHSLPSPAIDDACMKAWAHSYGGCGFGLWGKSGVWKLVGNRIADEAALLSRTPGCNYRDAQALCDVWQLDRLRAKYCVDHLISIRHEVERDECMDSLMQLLSGPALLFALLPDPLFNPVLIDHVKSFLNGGDTSSSIESRAEAHYANSARDSLARFTSLNETLKPLMQKISELSDMAQSMQQDSVTSIVEATPTAEELLSLPRAQVETWVRANPLDALPVLEQCIQLRPITPLETVGQDSHSLYDWLCLAYYHTAPQRLLSFIRSVHKSSPPPSPDYWVRRALDSIPPASSSVLPAQIDAHVHLLSTCGQSTVALRLCLAKGMWERACQLVRGKSASGVEFYELLSLLLAEGANRSSKEWCEAAALAPSGLNVHNVFGLLDVMRSESDDNESILLPPGSRGVTVSSLYDSIVW